MQGLNERQWLVLARLKLDLSYGWEADHGLASSNTSTYAIPSYPI